MDYKSSEVKAGIFIVFSFLLFIGFIAVIVGVKSFKEKSIYRARFSYVGGIEKGSAVRFAGLPVGSVREIRLPDDGFPGAEVVLEVEKGTPVRAGSRAFMTTIGIMGAFYIEITPGDPSEPLLPPGSLLTSEDVTPYAQISGVAADAVEELTELLRRLNDVLNEQNRKELATLIHSISQVAATTEQNFQQTLSRLNELIESANRTASAAAAAMEANDATFRHSLTTLDSALVESRQVLQSAVSILDQLDGSLAQNETRIDQIIKNLNAAAANLNELSRSVKEQPWSLVRKSYPPERKLPEDKSK
ncbi:MAG: MlaD family protein [candidate division KSB1 bacterium]|nr:MlaD family protein [candidate division KSB1 bacterium]MDZ7345364.1 MlaD family protein [candidate division KSB1 bacterium]